VAERLKKAGEKNISSLYHTRSKCPKETKTKEKAITK
jgi:hypothetical protein